MSLARDSLNGEYVLSCLYMSRSLSSRLFSIRQTAAPSGLCSVLYVCVCVCVCVCVRVCVCCGVLREFVSVGWVCV